MFLSAVVAVLILRSNLTETQLFLALAIVPVAMTLAEAFSPHTWDGPFLYLVGGMSLIRGAGAIRHGCKCLTLR